MLKETDVSQHEDCENNQGQDIAYVKSGPFWEVESFSKIGFCHEVFEAPSIAGSTEQQVNQAAKRKQVVADKKIFKIQDRSAGKLQAA